MKAKKKKGFTLVELIIVVAIFSIIMFSVVRLIDPVTTFFTRSSNFENSTACVDNMKRCIEGNLKYADRVRAYSQYLPYDTTGATGYAPSTQLQAHVTDFYNAFFLNRKFLDTSGYIYVLVFDNTILAPDSGPTGSPAYGISSYAQISDFTSAKKNAGKIVLYKFYFDNYNTSYDEISEILNSTAPGKKGSITPWAVNQKLYGAFEYRFSLGSSDASFTATTSATTTSVTTSTSATTSGTGVTTAPIVLPIGDSFDPQDCTITITSNEIRRDNGNHCLIRMSDTQTNTASFAMKNVLDAQNQYLTPSFDYLTVCVGDETLPYHQYTATPVPRYANLDKNTTAAFDGFYFIFTNPETMDSNNAGYSNQSGILTTTTAATSATTST